MKYIPCIICFNKITTDKKNAIATICDSCSHRDIYKLLKNVNYKMVLDATKKQIILTKEGEIV